MNVVEKKKRRSLENLSKEEIATFSADYRANIKTDRQLGAEYGVSHTTVQKWGRRLGLEKDLAGKIQARAAAQVAKDAVAREVASDSVATEHQIVEANALMQADIIRAHRKNITRSRSLAMSLLGELEITTTHLDLFEQLGELLHEPDEKGQDKRYEIYNKVISMASRIDGVKKLSETLKVLIGLERQAFGIKDDSDADKPISALRKILDEIDGKTASLLACE